MAPYSHWDAFKLLDDGAMHGVLLDLHEVLSEDQRHFGYRVANEIARFVTLAAEQARATPEVMWGAFDLAILQKVLPKFHGTQQELEPALLSLFRFAVADRELPDAAALEPEAWVPSGERITRRPPGGSLELPRLPRTATKVWRMLQRLRRQGFTSFIE